jgi:hypothetical protein
MSQQIAQLDRPNATVRELRPTVFDEALQDHERTTNPARGIVTAVFISVPVWAAFGFAVYMFS